MTVEELNNEIQKCFFDAPDGLGGIVRACDSSKLFRLHLILINECIERITILTEDNIQLCRRIDDLEAQVRLQALIERLREPLPIKGKHNENLH